MALGVGTAAERQRWSEVSEMKVLDEPPLPLDEKMENDFVGNEERPRERLARMIESKRAIRESVATIVSRSWMNSLKAVNTLDWSLIFIYHKTYLGSVSAS